MGIVEENGYLFHDGLISDFIVIEDDRIDEYVDFVNKNQIQSISINTLHYNRKEIDFLARCNNIERIMITNDNINDLSVFYDMRNLRYLVLGGVAGELDMSRLGYLEELYLGWSRNVKRLEYCAGIKRMSLRRYNPKAKNLTELSSLQKLEELTITQSAITSLKGCAELSLLTKLELNYMTKLKYLDALDGISSTLKSLRFYSCKSIQNHEYVAILNELELLAFNACGDIPSVGFIRELTKLKSLILMDTNIVDGDLSPCIGLDYVGFLNKKHYSHKNEDFKTNTLT